jgi:DNA invertase Pin-like site-specific DNA recombinase
MFLEGILTASKAYLEHLGTSSNTRGMNMALVGYARVSTTDQDHATQVERLGAAGCTKVFSEKKSGTTQKGRTALEECLDYIKDGDTLVFTKIDRLARSSRDLQNLVHELKERGVTIMALDQQIDTRTAAGNAFLGMLAVFAEFETNIRKERQLEGIAKAKEEGAYKGRKPTAQAKRAAVEALLVQGMSKPKIAEALGMSVASVYNVLKAA